MERKRKRMRKRRQGQEVKGQGEEKGLEKTDDDKKEENGRRATLKSLH